MQIGSYRKQLTSIFREHAFESPDLEASFILEEVLQISGMELILHLNEELPEHLKEKAEDFLHRRLNNEPFQYIFGWAPFRELKLKVGPGVLIPRPETEFMLDSVIRKLPENSTVCELGTGSGAIALSLAVERPDLKVWGSELSPEALAWSELNRKEYFQNTVHFLQGSLFEPFPPDLKFDAVVANLPYIAEEERNDLPPNVRDFEPSMALFAPEHGFALIRQAIWESSKHLNRQYSQLFFELGEQQGMQAVQCALSTGFFQQAEIKHDQYGVPRWLYACRTEEKNE